MPSMLNLEKARVAELVEDLLALNALTAKLWMAAAVVVVEVPLLGNWTRSQTHSLPLAWLSIDRCSQQRKQVRVVEQA